MLVRIALTSRSTAGTTSSTNRRTYYSVAPAGQKTKCIHGDGSCPLGQSLNPEFDRTIQTLISTLRTNRANEVVQAADLGGIATSCRGPLVQRGDARSRESGRAPLDDQGTGASWPAVGVRGGRARGRSRDPPAVERQFRRAARWSGCSRTRGGRARSPRPATRQRIAALADWPPARLGFHVQPSQANFVLVRVRDAAAFPARAPV
jgi:hypothetical protein